MSCCSQNGAGLSTNGKVASEGRACCAPTEKENEAGYKNNGTHGAVQVRLFTPAYFLLACAQCDVCNCSTSLPKFEGESLPCAELFGASLQLYTGQQPIIFRGT